MLVKHTMPFSHKALAFAPLLLAAAAQSASLQPDWFQPTLRLPVNSSHFVVGQLDGDSAREVVLGSDNRIFVLDYAGAGNYQLRHLDNGDFEYPLSGVVMGAYRNPQLTWDNLVYLDNSKVGFISGFPVVQDGLLPGPVLLDKVSAGPLAGPNTLNFFGTGNGLFQIVNAQGQRLYANRLLASREYAFGQVDTDLQLELVFARNDGTGFDVYDGASRALQLSLDAFGTVHSFVLADLDADGKDELVVNLSGNLAVYDLDNGNRKFLRSVPGRSASYSIAVADFDGDGKLEVAAPTTIGQTEGISLYDGVTGALKRQVTMPGPAGPWTLRGGDFDGDNQVELLRYSGSYGIRTTQIDIADLRNRRVEWSSSHVKGLPFHIAVGDINGDGQQDIVYADQIPNSSRPLMALDGKTKKEIWREQPGSLPTNLLTFPYVTLANIDADPQDEIIGVVHRLDGGHIIAYDAKDEVLNIETAPFSGQPLAIAVGDIDANGVIDLLVSTLEVGTPNKGYVYAFRSDTGAQIWKSPELVAGAGIPSFFRVAQLDRDAQLEIVVSDKYTRAYDGKTKGVQWNVRNTSPTTAIATGDYDNDGQPEVFIASENGSLIGRNGRTGLQVRTIAGKVSPGENAGTGLVLFDAFAGNAKDFIFLDAGKLAAVAYVGGGVGFGKWTLDNFPVSAPSSALSIPIADLDGDGIPEAVLSGPYGLVTVELRR
ncbi:MAG: VCBS repeat-containing protein [Fimbriimonadaceae bacterium]|nr:VCBS repeat-containing protein [Fimbriimonadaceae bacterium]QYK55885.1 MAG: VCBS repeat-containing protein [Fimbriimonadaceae bacterium]